MIWQTLFGKCIHESPSGYKVYQNFFYRWLTYNSPALQTVLNRLRPKRPVLHYLPALTLMARTYPNNYCLLGLGGAAVPHLLSLSHAHFNNIVVDYSEEVIEIGRRFFMVGKIPYLSITQADALTYLKQCKIVFPHLIIDLYEADCFPKNCANVEFFLQCKECIEEEGFVAINIASLKQQWSLLQLVKNQFANTLVIPVKKSCNMIVIASKKEDKEWFLDKIRSAGEVKKISWVPKWGYVAEM